MRSHADIAAPEKETERALCSASGDAVVASPELARRACPICGTPLTGRQRSACSPRHRAALSGRQRVPLPAAGSQLSLDARFSSYSTLIYFDPGTYVVRFVTPGTTTVVAETEAFPVAAGQVRAITLQRQPGGVWRTSIVAEE